MTDILGPASVGAVTTRPGRTVVRGSSNTWFIDCTSQQAADGTLCPADYFNDGLAQFRTLFTASGIVQDNLDDMTWRAVQSVGIRYGVDIGTAQAVKVNFINPVLTLAVGPPPLICLIKAANAAVGPSTFQANATAPTTLAWGDGTATAPGDWVAGDQLLVIYNGSTWDIISIGKRPSAVSAYGGCCYLSLSGANLLLSRSNGMNLIINGAVQPIPVNGVSMGPGGVIPSTFYYIYAYMAGGGTMTLVPLTTPHTQGADGTEVCVSDPTRALVGAAYTDPTGQFADTDGLRYVLSWFNRRQKNSRTFLTAAASVPGYTISQNIWVEVSTALRNKFISWATDLVAYSASGEMWASGGNGGSDAAAAVAFDGIQPQEQPGGYIGNLQRGALNFSGTKLVTEGVAHYATLLGSNLSGNPVGVTTFAGGWNPALTNPQLPALVNVTVRG